MRDLSCTRTIAQAGGQGFDQDRPGGAVEEKKKGQALDGDWVQMGGRGAGLNQEIVWCPACGTYECVCNEMGIKMHAW